MGSSIPTCEATDASAQGARSLHGYEYKEQAAEAAPYERAAAATFGIAGITTPRTTKVHITDKKGHQIAARLNTSGSYNGKEKTGEGGSKDPGDKGSATRRVRAPARKEPEPLHHAE